MYIRLQFVFVSVSIYVIWQRTLENFCLSVHPFKQPTIPAIIIDYLGYFVGLFSKFFFVVQFFFSSFSLLLFFCFCSGIASSWINEAFHFSSIIERLNISIISRHINTCVCMYVCIYNMILFFVIVVIVIIIIVVAVVFIYKLQP